MTRLFTRLNCEKCGTHHGDTMYITGVKSIEKGLCIRCEYDEYINSTKNSKDECRVR